MSEHEEELVMDSALRLFLAQAKEWVCECGQRCEPTDPNWKWNGTDWEHVHGRARIVAGREHAR
jgi:hypothetical protein